MRWLLDLWRWLHGWRRDVEDPFNLDFPEPPDSEPAIPDDALLCPVDPPSDEELSTLPGRLE